MTLILPMMIWAGGSIILSQLLVGYIMIWITGASFVKSPIGTACLLILSYALSLFLVLYVPSLFSHNLKSGNNNKASANKRKKELKVLGLSDWPTWTDIGLAPVGFVVYLVLAAGLVALFSLFPWFDVSQAQDVGFEHYIAGFDRSIAFISIVVVAPVVEEIIFRGWLYGNIRERTNKKLGAAWSIVVSTLLVSLAFGVMHMQWNVGVNVFVMSVVACLMREITGTIHSGIFLHMIKNGVAFYFLYLVGFM